MKFFLALGFIFFHLSASSQQDSSLRLRAFPITDYIVVVDDSIQIVQVELPDGFTIPLNQMGILYGTYINSQSDARMKATGKCHLVKGNYHYFGMVVPKNVVAPVKDDIVYTFVKRTSVYEKYVIPVATHFTGLLNVYGERLYDRFLVFSGWTEKDEIRFMDSVRADIRFTGQYMLSNQPELDKVIASGPYKGQSTLYIMAEASNKDIEGFFRYVIANPRIYAGREWKISEIFATWLSEGSPGTD